MENLAEVTQSPSLSTAPVTPKSRKMGGEGSGLVHRLSDVPEVSKRTHSFICILLPWLTHSVRKNWANWFFTLNALSIPSALLLSEK